jgi:hypothetical protein
MIEQLMNQCQTLKTLAGISDTWTIRLEIVHVNCERKFQASGGGDRKGIADKPEDALQALKLNLMILVEGQTKTLQDKMEKQHEQLRKMETALQVVGGNNGSQINS